jgi:alpha-ribazole phosphatase
VSDTSTTRVYLLRHGEVSTTEIHYGQTDVPLSSRGRQQAEAAAAALSGLSLSAVYASDLQRAAQGADWVASHHALAPHYDCAFREMHLGLLEGVPHARSRVEHPELFAKRYRDLVDEAFPGGENLRQVAARACAALDPILDQHRGQTIAVVAHNSVNRIILGRALGLPSDQIFAFAQDYGCINWIDFAPEAARVGLMNWTPAAPCAEAGGGRHPP